MNNVIPLNRSGLSPEALQALDEIVERRMQATGETLYQAREHVSKWLMSFCDDSCPKDDTNVN